MVFGGILILLVPVFFISTVTFINSSRTSEDIARLQFGQIAQSLSGVIEIALEKDLGVLDKLANDPEVAKAMARSQKGTLRKRLTDAYRVFSPNYEGLAVFNTDGLIYCDGVDPDREGIDIADRKYFHDARRGKPGIGAVVRSKATGMPIFGVSAPIFSPEMEFLGGVLGVIKVDYLIDFISTIKVGKTGYAFMLDPDGMVIAHPDKNIVLKLKIRDVAGFEALTGKLENRRADAVSYSYGGKEKIAGLAPVGLTGWIIGVTQNREEITSLARDNMTSILMISALFTLLTILAVLVFSNRISVPDIGNHHGVCRTHPGRVAGG